MGMDERTERLLGNEGMERLRRATVAIYGIGGVGGHAAEALCRAGVGKLILVDGDVVAESNLNRQMVATRETIGWPKVAAAAARFRAIRPDMELSLHQVFYLPERDGSPGSGEGLMRGADYVIDAVDTVTAKVGLVLEARRLGIPIISAMGAGNKLDPTGFRVADLYETEVCPLCRVMRHELRKRGVERLKVVYSREVPVDVGGPPVGSVSFVPGAAGLALAGAVIRDIIKTEREGEKE